MIHHMYSMRFRGTPLCMALSTGTAHPSIFINVHPSLHHVQGPSSRRDRGRAVPRHRSRGTRLRRANRTNRYDYLLITTRSCKYAAPPNPLSVTVMGKADGIALLQWHQHRDGRQDGKANKIVVVGGGAGPLPSVTRPLACVHVKCAC
jgi:hypothetical protein